MARNILLKLTGDPSDAKRAIQQTQGDLKELGKTDAKPRVTIHEEAAKARLDVLQKRLHNLGRQTQTPQVKIATGQALRQIERVERELETRLKDRTVDIRFREHGAGGTGGIRGRGGALLPLLGSAGAAGGAAATAGGFTAIKTSSDINEATSKNKTIFKESADAVEDFAKRSAAGLGISRKEALDATGTFGGLLTALGIAPARAAKMSVELTKLAADLGSFNNKSTQDAIDAIHSLFVGETEPIRAFNVNTNDAQLRQAAKRLGLVKDTKTELTPRQRTLAANEVLFGDQTKTARGDFKRTKNELANQVKILQAELSDRLGKTGDIAKPFVTDGIHVLTAAMRGDFREGIRPLRDIVIETLKAPGRYLLFLHKPFIGLGRMLAGAIREGLGSIFNEVANLADSVFGGEDLRKIQKGKIRPIHFPAKINSVGGRTGASGRNPVRGDIPGGKLRARGAVVEQHYHGDIVLPPTAAPIGDPAYDARRLHRGLQALGAGP